MDPPVNRLAAPASVAVVALIETSSAPDPTQLLWLRMADLRFQVRDSVSVNCVNYRGCSSYLLRNAFDRQQLRLSNGIYQLLSKMDGRRTVAQICAQQLATTSQPVATKHEVLTALTQLHAAGMLTADEPRNIDTLIAQQKAQTQRKRMARWMRVLSPRFALFDPDSFLNRTFPGVAWLFHRRFALVWFAVAMFAALQALMHWDALTTYGAQRLDDPRQWVLLICLYPIVKALHELGHCYAAKSGGAAVNETGITLLVFLPVPYVDASAASVFADKYRRMLVAAAGIMVEVFVASLALFVWLLVDDTLVRDIAFAVMLIGGVSTVLFNGNPLLRFDGYYILTDAIEIPNLSSRASHYYGYLAKRYLLGVRSEKLPQSTDGERRWFVFYGATATLYRIGVSIGIALFLIVTVPVLGVLMAAWLLVAQLVFPLVRQLRYLLFNPALSGRRVGALSVISGAFCVLFGVLAFVPFPSSTLVDGVVLLPDQAVVRAEVDGFLHQQSAADQTSIGQGDVLFELTNSQLTTDIAVMRGRVHELQARHDLFGIDERVAREIHGERLIEAHADLAQLQQRYASLTVHSPRAGVLQVPFGDNYLGRFVRQGDMLAYVANRAEAVINVVATQIDASRIRDGTESIEVRLVERTAVALPGRLLGEVPLASDKLPSAALGSRTGGAIQVDARDVRGITALQPVFGFKVAIPFSEPGQFVGSRASVRFQHRASPVLSRWYHALRHTLFRKIDA